MISWMENGQSEKKYKKNSDVFYECFLVTYEAKCKKKCF